MRESKIDDLSTATGSGRAAIPTMLRALSPERALTSTNVRSAGWNGEESVWWLSF